jgi:hypothetical protein
MTQSFTINSGFTLQAAQAELAKQWHERKWLQITFNFDKFRTLPQNSSLHLYCSHLSIAFNEAGYDMTKVLSHHADIRKSAYRYMKLLTATQPERWVYLLTGLARRVSDEKQEDKRISQR